MKIIRKNSANIALAKIVDFFSKNGIDSIENALDRRIAVDCSRIIGDKESFIVTVEIDNSFIENNDFLMSLNNLTRTNLKWHFSTNNNKIFVGFIDDPQFSGNRCSFFIIEKFLKEIIKNAQLS